MFNHYYYLVASLPELVQEVRKQPVLLSDLKTIIEEHLSSAHLNEAKKLFLTYDNQNLLNLLEKQHKPFQTLGNYALETLEQNIKEPVSLEQYLNNFIEYYKSATPPNEELSWEDNLTAAYYDYARTVKNRFLRGWFRFDFTLKNIQAAISARSSNVNRAHVVLGNDQIAVSLKTSPLRDFGISNQFPLMERIVTIHESGNLLQQELEIDNIRWEYIDNQLTYNYFGVELIYAFIIKSMIIERWVQLEPQTGRQMFERIINEIKMSYEFPKEFSINERRKETNHR